MISHLYFMRLLLVTLLSSLAVISAQPQDSVIDPAQTAPIRFGSSEPVLAIKPREFQIELPNISDPLLDRRPRQNQYVRRPHFGQVSHQPQFYPQNNQQPQLNNQYASQQRVPPVYIQPQFPRYELRPQPYRPPPPPPQPQPVAPARPQPRPQPPREQYKELPPAATRAPLPPATLAPQPRPWPRTSPAPYIEPVASTTERYRPEPVRPKATTPKPQTTTEYVPPPTTTPRPRPTTTRPRPRPTTTPRATTTTPRATTTTPRPTTTTPRPTTTTPRPTTTTPRPTTTTPRPTTTTPKPTTTTPKPAPITEEYEPAAVEKVYDETFVGQYYYGKRGEGNNTFPLPSCFYNPSGYVCCNLMLNELMTTSFEETRTKKISNCNVQKIANKLQVHSEKIFSSQFETIVSYEDFSQKIHFRKDLVCKIEIEGRFILAYATPNQVEQEKIIPTVPSVDIVKDSDVLKQQVLQKIRQIDTTSSDSSNF